MFRELRLYALMEVGEKDEDTKAAVRNGILGTSYSISGTSVVHACNSLMNQTRYMAHKNDLCVFSNKKICQT